MSTKKTPATEPSARPGLLHDWLLQQQIGPAFRKHDFLQRAIVVVVPAFWKVNPNGAPHAPIQMMIFYSQDAEIRLDSVVAAYTHDSQDPNLPLGIGNHDLFEAIGNMAAASHPGEPLEMPIVMCAPSFFVGGEMDIENDDGGVLDAFFVYAKFERGAGGVLCTRRDDRMGERMDDFLAKVTKNPC